MSRDGSPAAMRRTGNTGSSSAYRVGLTHEDAAGTDVWTKGETAGER